LFICIGCICYISIEFYVEANSIVENIYKERIISFGDLTKKLFGKKMRVFLIIKVIF